MHRDLKPENIMVTPAGRAKILDFGLARTTGLQSAGGVPANLDGQTQTESGLLMGTVPYMSPEQARGSVADFRSDQFSFGLILYEMATGRSAFRREAPAQTLEAIIHQEPGPTPFPGINAQAPLLLWWIVERCLAKNPGDRYASTRQPLSPVCCGQTGDRTDVCSWRAQNGQARRGHSPGLACLTLEVKETLGAARW